MQRIALIWHHLATAFAIGLCGWVLCGCEPQSADTPLLVQVHGEVRFSVTRIGTFLDELAYGNKRGIYILHDNKTGKDYVGISGIGISELGSHSDGDDTVKDER